MATQKPQFDMDAALKAQVIVKSGVQTAESSGGLIDVSHLDSISEFDSRDHLGKVIEST
jgi:hypothetical protein